MSYSMKNPIMKEGSIWYTITHIEELDREKYLKLVRGVAVFVGLAMIVSLAVFAVIAFLGGIGNVVRVILSMNLSLFALGLLAVFAGYMLRFIKWSFIILALPLAASLCIEGRCESANSNLSLMLFISFGLV